MAVTSMDLAMAGMQIPVQISKAVTGTLVAGRPTSLWALAGTPGAGAFDTTLNGVTLSSSSAQVAGQIQHNDPVSGNAYLARLTGAATQPGMLMLLDRIWHNGGLNVTLTTAQSITSPTWPARDAIGATAGDRVLIAVEVSAAVGAGTPTLTLGYTNKAGTAGRTSTNSLATAASAAAGTVYFMGLQSGDVGVQSVQSLTLSATWTSGTINLVAYRVLATLELPGANIANAIDPLTGGLPRLFNGTVPWMVFVPSTTTSTGFIGSYVETQG